MLFINIYHDMSTSGVTKQMQFVWMLELLLTRESACQNAYPKMSWHFHIHFFKHYLKYMDITTSTLIQYKDAILSL